MIKAFGLCGLNALTTVVIRVRVQWRTREGPKLKWNIAAQGTSKFTVNIGLCLVGCISCTLNFIGHLPHQSHRHTCWMVHWNAHLTRTIPHPELHHRRERIPHHDIQHFGNLSSCLRHPVFHFHNSFGSPRVHRRHVVVVVISFIFQQQRRLLENITVL